MTRAKASYETLFEKSLEKLGSGAPGIAEMWALPGSPHEAGATGALVKMEGGPEGGGTIVYFVCDDYAVQAKRAGNGGKIMKDKCSIGPYGNITLLYDTEGNAIGLHSMK